MAVFVGSFENRVDKKGRLSVPAPFRQALEGQSFQGIIVFPSRRADALEGCGMDLMEKLIEQQDEDDMFGDGPETDPANIFYNLQRVPFDGDGRVILPADMREDSDITDMAIFVGVGKRFQIWAPERLESYRNRNGEGKA